MTIHEANMRLLFSLFELYDNSEASNIADLVMEKITGWKRIDRVINKEVKLSSPKEQQLNQYMEQLSFHRPVQYVLNEAWFGGMKFYVDENVLIPRPETEELADLAIKDVLKNNNQSIAILDIGTGSGCIAIGIKKNLPGANVYAVDVSGGALEVARKNADENNTAIQFILSDILDEKKWIHLPDVDLIISNPPYIPQNQINEMSSNVIEHEPHLALFVPDENPLVFYKMIAGIAEKKLKPGGKIFVEVHENSAGQVAELFGSFKTAIKKDLQGKDRFIEASVK